MLRAASDRSSRPDRASAVEPRRGQGNTVARFITIYRYFINMELINRNDENRPGGSFIKMMKRCHRGRVERRGNAPAGAICEARSRLSYLGASTG